MNPSSNDLSTFDSRQMLTSFSNDNKTAKISNVAETTMPIQSSPVAQSLTNANGLSNKITISCNSESFQKPWNIHSDLGTKHSGNSSFKNGGFVLLTEPSQRDRISRERGPDESQWEYEDRRRKEKEPVRDHY